MRDGGRGGSIWLVLLLGILAGGCAGAFVGGVASLAVSRGTLPPLIGQLVPTAVPSPTATATPLPTRTPRPTVTPTPPPTATATPTATPLPTPTVVARLEDVVSRVADSVVTIVLADGPGGEPYGFGSGVVLFEADLVLTNAHVVDGAGQITVVAADDREVSATVAGSDPFSDLALLRLDAPLDLPPLALEVGRPLRVGEPVFAVGSALGDFRNSVTSGIVSGLGRMVWVPEAGFAYEALIQTDAAINQGNSGGPLIDAEGRVVGINTLVVRAGLGQNGVDGLGFAIDAATIARVGTLLREAGRVPRPFFGVQHEALNPPLARLYGIAPERRDGALVVQVDPGSPAAAAGLLRGDLLLAVEGVDISVSQPFVNLLYRHAAGDTVRIRLLRGGQEIEVEVTLAD